ncbi:MAG: lamin tail domain-containing protein, partial [Paenibacillus macerans]|nr:lamin tail domain-containing protein [Paenibacillus macerans]
DESTGNAAEGQEQTLQIVHTPASATHEAGQDLTIAALITGAQTTVTASVYYRVDGQGLEEVSMAGGSGDEYSADLNGGGLSGSSLTYYIEARDEEGTSARSDDFTVELVRGGQPGIEAKPLDLLITELVPDSDNVNGADAYEFVEVYNNSGRDLDFADFKLVYNTSTEWPLEGSANAVIPAGKAIVLWVMNGKNNQLTAGDFNRNYGTGLTEGTDLFRISGGGGMSNAGPRQLEIKDAAGATLVSAAYENDAQTQMNMGIFYQRPTDGNVAMIMMDGPGTLPATPGAVTQEQTEAPAGAAFSIKHAPVTSVDAAAGMTVEASLEPAGPEMAGVTLNFLYKTASQSRYAVIAMKAQDGVYTASVPADQLTEPSLEYRIEAVGGSQPVSTDLYTVQVVNFPDFDPQKAPPLLVTEIVANTTNVNGADGYELVEIYNNSDRDVNFRNYKLYYRYTDKGPPGDVLWSPDKQDFVIPSGQAVVFWIISDSITALTAADFNKFYGTSLEENVD